MSALNDLPPPGTSRRGGPEEYAVEWFLPCLWERHEAEGGAVFHGHRPHREGGEEANPLYLFAME